MSLFKMSLKQERERLELQAKKISHKIKNAKSDSQRIALELKYIDKINEVNRLWHRRLLK